MNQQGVGNSSSSSSGITRNVSNVSLGGATSAAAGGGGDVDAAAYAEENQFVGVLSALIALRCLPLAMKMVRLLEEHHVGIGTDSHCHAHTHIHTEICPRIEHHRLRQLFDTYDAPSHPPVIF